MNRKLLLILLAIFAIVIAGCTGGGTTDGETTDEDDGVAVAQVDETNNDDDEADEAPRATDIPTIPVVIAVQNIPRGTVIDRERVDVILFPATSVPDGAFAEVNDVIGSIAATDIFVEELILARKLVSDLNSLGSTGSDAAAILDPARVAIAVPIDRITSVAYALQPGDRVDVIVSMLFVDIDQDFQTILPNNITIGRYFAGFETDPILGETVLVRNFDIPPFEGAREPYTFNAEGVDSRSVGVGDGVAVSGDFSFNTNVRDDIILPVVVEPQEQQRPRLVTQRTVTDAQVVWVGEFPRDGRIFAPAPTPTPVVTPDPAAEPAADGGGDGEGEPVATPVPDRPSIVTLAVRPQDAVVLTYMAEASIPLTFALRSARTQGLPDTTSVTLNYILDTYNISVPETRNFGIEPAIRSIRGITLQDISATEATTTEEGEGGEGN
ncbi:MAG: Flp pilus assembly protein CpaB [Chloroflexota bacterium]